MQTLVLNNFQTQRLPKTQNLNFTLWLQKILVNAEENRLGLVAILILFQVTIAGFNVVIPPMIGASAYLMAPGIVMAFLSNGIALAQAEMKWVLAGFALSMIINAAVSIYCFAQLIWS